MEQKTSLRVSVYGRVGSADQASRNYLDNMENCHIIER